MSNARNLSKLIPSSAGLIQTANILDDAITTAKILDANVTTAKILDANVTTAKVADDAVTNAKIGAGAVTNTEVNASAAIVATKLGTMATANMPSGSIIQVVTLNKTTGHDVQTHNTWTSLYGDSDCLKITPTATSSKIIIHYMLDRGNGSTSGEAQTDYRIITTIGGSQSNYPLSSGVINIPTDPGYRYGSLGSFTGTVISPSTTSEITFNIQTNVQNSKKGTLNPYQYSCGITAMEIKG